MSYNSLYSNSLKTVYHCLRYMVLLLRRILINQDTSLFHRVIIINNGYFITGLPERCVQPEISQPWQNWHFGLLWGLHRPQGPSSSLLCHAKGIFQSPFGSGCTLECQPSYPNGRKQNEDKERQWPRSCTSHLLRQFLEAATWYFCLCFVDQNNCDIIGSLILGRLRLS